MDALKVIKKIPRVISGSEHNARKLQALQQQLQALQQQSQDLLQHLHFLPQQLQPLQQQLQPSQQQSNLTTILQNSKKQTDIIIV